MLKRMNLTERFIAWLETKDPHERYPWTDRCNCACGQFIRDSGIERGSDEEYQVWHKFNYIAGGLHDLTPYEGWEVKPEGWTFGQLKDRILAAHGAEVG